MLPKPLQAQISSLTAEMENINRLIAENHSRQKTTEDLLSTLTQRVLELESQQKTIGDLFSTLTQRASTQPLADSSVIAKTILDIVLPAVRESIQALKTHFDGVIDRIISAKAWNLSPHEFTAICTAFEGIPTPPVHERRQENHQETINNSQRIPIFPPLLVYYSEIDQALHNLVVPTIREELEALKTHLDAIAKRISAEAQDRRESGINQDPRKPFPHTSSSTENHSARNLANPPLGNRGDTIDSPHSIPTPRATPPPPAHSSDIDQAIRDLVLPAIRKEIRGMKAYFDGVIERLVSAKAQDRAARR